MAHRTFTIRMLLFCRQWYYKSSAILQRWIGRSAMLASARWDQREYTGGSTKRIENLSSAYEKANSQWEQLFKCCLFLRRVEFHARVGFLFPNSQSKIKEALYTHSQDRGGPIFLKTSAPHYRPIEWTYFQPDPYWLQYLLMIGKM